MEKTIKINISGIVFEINEDAFEVLKDYLQRITNLLKDTLGGNEMIEDIEARIAEIFQSGPSWKTGVISMEEVEEMKKTMGSPEEIAGDLENEPAHEYQRHEKRLFRDLDHSMIGGVCSGISNYLRIEAVWIRILFVLFSIFYFSGVIIYVILWIALPSLQGHHMPEGGRRTTSPHHRHSGERIEHESYSGNSNSSQHAVPPSRIGNAFNEVFRIFGKIFFIFFRIILAVIGVSFIIAGFSLLVSFLVLILFNGTVFAGNIFNTEIFYLPDFLSFIVDPSLTTILIILSSIVIILPLAALVYWGIRMVFQFRVRDTVLNLVMFIIWIISCTALAVLLFSEGISFAESGRTTETFNLPPADTIYLKTGNNQEDLSFDKEVKLPFDDFTLYLDETDRIIWGTPEIDIYSTEKEGHVEIVKYSSGRTRKDAMAKADRLEYDLNVYNNYISADHFFAIPEGNKWSGANLKVRIYIPVGSVIFIDENVEEILDSYLGNGVYSYNTGGKFWLMTSEGLEKTE